MLLVAPSLVGLTLVLPLAGVVQKNPKKPPQDSFPTLPRKFPLTQRFFLSHYTVNPPVVYLVCRHPAFIPLSNF